MYIHYDSRKADKRVWSVRLDASVYNEKRWSIFLYFNPQLMLKKIATEKIVRNFILGKKMSRHQKFHVAAIVWQDSLPLQRLVCDWAAEG